MLFITRLRDLQYDPSRGEPHDWISAVATHRLVDQERYRKKHVTERLGSEARDQLASREQDPAVVAERNQVAKLVREALAELRTLVSQRDYEAFTLHCAQGMSVREVADRLGMTEAAVSSIRHRMCVKLRPILARRFNQSDASR